MELDERKKKILQAVIRNYLETGEPVGSRTISKDTDLNLSSATIRNEMSDLEEMGYILQPHTSAGRIPSDKGYRFYVDTMLEEREREVEELKGLLFEKNEKMDTLLKRVARVLATNTNYAAMITSPQYQRNKLKFIQLSRVDEHQILAVVVVEGNVIKNTMLHVDEALDDATLLKLNILLNTHLNGLSIDEINLGMISAMKQQAGIHSSIVSGVVDAVAEAIRSDEDLRIYTSGTNNILKYPELTDNREKASELINVFEEKKVLGELVQETLSDENNTGIQVYIGNETPVQSMKDCSVVTATYELGEGMRGTIGIIGPKRMDYDKVIGLIAGGDNAFVKAKEGAEDSKEQGAQALKEIDLKPEDCVIGIAASGRTPFVIGALEYAMETGAGTAALVCNRNSEIARLVPDTIEAVPGPEVLTGSTRLKAGTATKLVLNMISTISMVQAGKVFKNYMVDVKTTNEKLVQRAKNIIQAVTGCSAAQAAKQLEASGHHVKTAIIMELAHTGKEEAQKLLKEHHGHIDRVLASLHIEYCWKRIQPGTSEKG